MSHVLSFMNVPQAWKSPKAHPAQGVIKRNWVPTGRIDFATRLNGDPAEADEPSEFKLLVEERRIVESVTGLENLEIQWRLATLKEAKAVIGQYHRFLTENSLIRSVTDDVPLAPKRLQNMHDSSAA
ncbi:MAG TPA: hypothetical protein VFA53_03550 [Xanthobacteraceae bacterium]|nr:hypothetical protein [Xanthobacteraceae bacterium]